MLKKVTVIIGFPLLFVLAGCVTISEPKDSKDHLLVGKLLQIGRNYDNYHGVNINTEHTAPIEVIIENTDTKLLYRAISAFDGSFYFENLPIAPYRIKFLSITLAMDRAMVKLQGQVDDEKSFMIIDGSVQNIGLIKWITDATEGQSIFYNKDYQQVKDIFKKTLKKSVWLDKEWINTKIIDYTRTLIQDADNSLSDNKLDSQGFQAVA